MGHSHIHSDHNHSQSAPLRVMLIAILLTFGYSIIEALGGWWTGSLALLGDAGHMASDALALIIATFAIWVSQKPPSQKHTYGLGRAEVVAAWLSSLIMLLISVAVIVEAVERIHQPSHVKGGMVMVIAFTGLIINLIIGWLLSRSQRTLNIRAALLHVLGDILGSFAALVAGAVIYETKWYPIDPILSIFIGILIAISSLRLLRESLLVLMEGVPANINVEDVGDAMRSVQTVKDIHDLHIWTLSSGRYALSAHIDFHELTEWSSVLEELTTLLSDRYNIDHITLQPEPEIFNCTPCKDPN